jgi:periplasmic divalent cation tolerance protein
MPEPPTVILVLTTEADAIRAEALASELLARRLVACISLIPITSMYRWQGALQRDMEVQLLMKTTVDRLDQLQAAVMELHSYDTPEWLSWPAQASPAYGGWAAEVVSPVDQQQAS